MAPEKCIPSIVLHTLLYRRKIRKQQTEVHNKKLFTLSKEQERPLFNILNTVVLCDLVQTPPEYVMKTLSLGPRSAVLDKFNPKDIFSRDSLFHFVVVWYVTFRRA